MIASALRAEIERSTKSMRARNPLFPGMPDGGKRGRTFSTPTSLQPMLDALDRAVADSPSRVALRAFFQYLAVENGVPWIRMMQERCGFPPEAFAFIGDGQDECRSRVEEDLDVIDAIVDDPQQLPVLRNELRAMISRFDRLCEEVSRVEHRGEVHVSAA